MPQFILLRSLPDLEQWVAASAKPIHFVPTMGGLHAAHGGLFSAAASPEARVLVSVFINPLQFGPTEDFHRYPRQLEADLSLAASHGAQALWAPSVEQVYPRGFAGLTQVLPAAELVQHLCGPLRPGHFQGVCTVVARLLALVKPARLYLGKKDWQQLQVLRRMVQDLGLPVQIIACSTKREPDGLPFSSRNSYLTPQQRAQAAALPKGLAEFKFKSGIDLVLDRQKILQPLRLQLEAAGLELEYLDLVGPLTLQPVQDFAGPILLAAAVRCGTTRLIDHRILMNRSPIIAIDGPAGAGKSTVTRLVAKELGLVYLDTGAMYRAVTWLLQRLALPIAETEQLVQVLADLNLRLEAQPQADQLVWVNGENITEQIRSAEITEAVSAVSALPSVRSALTSQQRRFGARGGLVAEGRDIGTAVFPQAELKVFLTATVAERARRRSADLAARGLPVPELIQLEQEIAHRDQLDSSREIAPLCQAPDALELISDGLTIKQVADQIISWYHQRLADLHDEGP